MILIHNQLNSGKLFTDNQEYAACICMQNKI